MVERDVILHRLYHIVTKKQLSQKEQAAELRPLDHTGDIKWSWLKMRKTHRVEYSFVLSVPRGRKGNDHKN